MAKFARQNKENENGANARRFHLEGVVMAKFARQNNDKMATSARQK